MPIPDFSQFSVITCISLLLGGSLCFSDFAYIARYVALCKIYRVTRLCYPALLVASDDAIRTQAKYLSDKNKCDCNTCLNEKANAILGKEVYHSLPADATPRGDAIRAISTLLDVIIAGCTCCGDGGTISFLLLSDHLPVIAGISAPPTGTFLSLKSKLPTEDVEMSGGAGGGEGGGGGGGGEVKPAE
jgi:hypothetical protein